ncbi:hypothetical protein DL96DRAFT_880634 [Flagelloscypha sp. PMI_526]|nr:hypothetical protein DL96DRAFT_880634 [Flagelloscypha sp. PMI_526]
MSTGDPSNDPPRWSRRSSPSGFKRGSACLNCRFFKIKCDGRRLHCGPGAAHPKDDPREYQDGPRSRTQALEYQIRQLEAQVLKLERHNQDISEELFSPVPIPRPTASSIGLDTTELKVIHPVTQVFANSLERRDPLGRL